MRAALTRIGEVRTVILLAAPADADLDGDRVPVAFEWAAADIFDRDLAAPAFQFPPVAARRAREWLARGDRCLVGRVHDRAATYLWVGTQVRDFPGASCPVGPGTAYVYKTFTLPEFRGRGLNTAALREARRRCARDGFQQVLIDVASDNVKSRRAIERAGFVAAGRLFLLRVGRVRQVWLPGPVRRRIAGAAVRA